MKVMEILSQNLHLHRKNGLKYFLQTSLKLLNQFS